MSTEFYDATVTCKYCGTSFKTRKVRTSAIRVDKRESDYHVIYKGANPMHYDISICPRCGYLMFEKFGELTDHKKKVLEEKYMSKIRDFSRLCGERSIDDVLRIYKLALFIASLTEEPPLVIAGLALRIAWTYREMGNNEEEARFLEQALEYYLKEFQEGQDDSKFGSLMYMIVELNIRLNRYEEVRKWVGNAISNKSIPRDIKNKISDRWQDYKATYCGKDLSVVD